MWKTLPIRPTGKYRVNHLEGLIYFFSHFRTRQNNLAAYEDEEHYLWLDHAVDETREQLGFVRAEVVMATCKTLQTDGKLDVARANNVLDLEIDELSIEPELLDDPGIFARGKLGIILGLSAGDDHLARGEDQGRSLRFTNTHDDGSETLD